jgi:putative thioredoxin
MTSPQFSRPGAIDLSGLAKSSSAPSTGSGSYTIEVTGEESLAADVVNRSVSVVVLLSVWSPDVPESVEINDTLAALADEFAGRFLLATLDAKTQSALVKAIGIPSVPLVLAVLRGQLAPLIQDPLPAPEMRALVQQVLQAAAAGGVTGTADPVRRPSAAQQGDDMLDQPLARFPEAEDALLRGDLDQAISLYEKALQTSPNDSEAVEGLARSRLLKRTVGANARKARDAAAERPDDVEAQILVADLDLVGGHVDDAFGRLLDLIRRTVGEDRDRVRRHLLDLFAVVGDADARVGTARRALTAALF